MIDSRFPNWDADIEKGNKNMLGKTIPDNVKEKMRKKLINRQDMSKKVAQYTLDGELVKVWDSINECGRNGFDASTISKCCKGKKKTHKGYIWKYIDE